MSRFLRLFVPFVLFAASLGAQAPPRAAAKSVKVMMGGTLIDGFGGRPIRNSVIVIEGEQIAAVRQVGTLQAPAGAEIISTEGMTVLPGLWDMHVHLMINGHSDYPHWDKTYPAQFGPVIMLASAKQLLKLFGGGERCGRRALREILEVCEILQSTTRLLIHLQVA